MNPERHLYPHIVATAVATTVHLLNSYNGNGHNGKIYGYKFKNICTMRLNSRCKITKMYFHQEKK